MGSRFWLPFGPSLLLLPIWSLLLLWRDMWFNVWPRRHWLFLWSLLLLFFSNFASYWRLTLLLIVDSSCLFCLFNIVSLSSSSLDWGIRTILLSSLIYGSFSFLGKIYVGFRGFLFFMNLSLKISFLLFSSCGCSLCFYCGFTPLTRNHFWDRTFRIIT